MGSNLYIFVKFKLLEKQTNNENNLNEKYNRFKPGNPEEN